MELPTVSISPRQHFDYRMTHSIVDGQDTFPFAVTNLSARNPLYDTENRNNQDVVGVCLTPSYVVAVVCDGCGSTHPEIERHSVSSNEVGAKLASVVVIREARRALGRRVSFRPEELVERVSRNVITAFRSTVKSFATRDELGAEKFIYDFLLTTVVGFIITETQFVIFSSGDGVVALNGKVEILPSPLEGVNYASNELLSVFCPKRFPSAIEKSPLKVHAAGDSKDVQSIFVGSDGMGQLVRQCPRETMEFLLRRPDPSQCQGGFDFAKEEFRRDIAWNPHLSINLTDDATFAAARRTKYPL